MRRTHSPSRSYDDGTGDAVAFGMRFGLGFRLSAAHDEDSDYWFSPNPRAFGHTGTCSAVHRSALSADPASLPSLPPACPPSLHS